MVYEHDFSLNYIANGLIEVFSKIIRICMIVTNCKRKDKIDSYQWLIVTGGGAIWSFLTWIRFFESVFKILLLSFTNDCRTISIKSFQVRWLGKWTLEDGWQESHKTPSGHTKSQRHRYDIEVFGSEPRSSADVSNRSWWTSDYAQLEGALFVHVSIQYPNYLPSYRQRNNPPLLLLLQRTQIPLHVLIIPKNNWKH